MTEIEKTQSTNDKQRIIKVLIPLFYEYYIFEYFYRLIPVLLERGMQVTVLTYDPKVTQRLAGQCPGVEVRQVAPFLRRFNSRSGILPYRALLWVIARIWARKLSKTYDFVIVPWTNKLIWHVISRTIPSMTCNNTMNFFDLEIEAQEIGWIDEQNPTIPQRVALFLEKVGFMRLPRLNHHILRFTGRELLDRFFGGRDVTRVSAMNGVNYLCVMGSRVRDNYYAAGIDRSKTTIEIVGSPSYEDIVEFKNSFGQQQQEEFLKANNLPVARPVYSLFLSPTSFTPIQRKEIVDVVSQINSTDPNAYFVIKFHPKTMAVELGRFETDLASLKHNIRFITDFNGEDFNMQLIKSSRCIVQKQSTVGYLAFLLDTPIVSYNIFETDYLDDMYELMGVSSHCRSKSELSEAIAGLNGAESKKNMESRHAKARDELCILAPSPCNLIADVIENHFAKPVAG